MATQNLPLGKPTLEEAIDYNPIIVAPDYPLTETLTLMNRIQAASCLLPNSEETFSEYIPVPIGANCVLVMEQEKISGIFTERDLVHLIASNADLASSRIADVMTRNVITLSQENFQDIFAVLFLFRRYQIRHLPIVDRQEKLVGIVSHESLRACLRPTNLLKLRRVADVMTSNVIQASLTSSAIDLAKLMATYRVSCVVIVEGDCDGIFRPVGIVTERDILQFRTLELDLSQIKAYEVMSTPLFLLNPEDSLCFAHKQMQKMRLRRLVVSWDWGKELGIITQTSLLRVFDPMEMYGVIETLQNTIKELKEEVTSKHNSSLPKSEISTELLIENQKQENNKQPNSQVLLHRLLNNLQNNLHSQINESQMSTAQRNRLLDQSLEQVHAIQELLLEQF